MKLLMIAESTEFDLIYRAIMRLRNEGYGNFIVVDGVVSVNGETIKHTWLEMFNGKIKDPSASKFGDAGIQYSNNSEYRDEYTPQDYLKKLKRDTAFTQLRR